MSAILQSNDAQALVTQRFAEAAIEVWDITTRDYPEETIFVVLVGEEELPTAAEIGTESIESSTRPALRGL